METIAAQRKPEPTGPHRFQSDIKEAKLAKNNTDHCRTTIW